MGAAHGSKSRLTKYAGCDKNASSRFKLRPTANVKRMIARLSPQSEATNAGQGGQAKASLLRLEGGSRQRRVSVARRRGKGALAISSNETPGQQTLSFVAMWARAPTSTPIPFSPLRSPGNARGLASCIAIAACAGNIFAGLKKQSGWGGFVTQDLARCRLAARRAALFYDGGTSPFVWPGRTGIGRRSPAAPCSCPPSPRGFGMRGRRCAKPRVPTPRRFPPRRRFAGPRFSWPASRPMRRR